MERQFKGPRRTDPLNLDDMYRRLNYENEATGAQTIPGGYPLKTIYEVKESETIRTSLFSAIDKHVNERIDRKIPRKIKLGKRPHQNYMVWMTSAGYDPGQGFTYARQGDEETAHIPVELDTSLPENTIICVH